MSIDLTNEDRALIVAALHHARDEFSAAMSVTGNGPIVRAALHSEAKRYQTLAQKVGKP